MTQKIFCENLKRFRLAKSYTQEQVANALHVNVQTVSRWECGMTLPDALTLPELAALYGVPVDDFYRKHSVAYQNYAQRLTAIYEKTRKPEDFMQCLFEYRKLMDEGPLSVEDQWNVASIHQWMAESCRDEALEWYDKILEGGGGSEEHSFYLACARRIQFLFALGRGEEAVRQQKIRAEADPENPREVDLLLIAYLYAEQFQQAYALFRQAVEKFPEDWELYLHGGEVCERTGKYEEAMQYYDRAGAIGTAFYDDLYCKANLFEKTGKYEKAAELYQTIAKKLRQKGLDVDAEMAEECAGRAAGRQA